jgi:hypothetical protein
MFDTLREGLMSLLNMGCLNHEQIGKSLEYMRRTLFAHLNLYLACIERKQTKRPKSITLFVEKPQIANITANLETECTEIVDPSSKIDNVLLSNATGSAEILDDMDGMEAEE